MQDQRLRRSTTAIWLAIAVLLGSGLALAGVRPLTKETPIIEVRVHGRTERVPGPRVRVSTALNVAGVSLHDGALLSVITHKVLDAHYVPASITVDGRLVSAQAFVPAGAAIDTEPGFDVTESTTDTEDSVAPPNPPDVEATIWYPGKPGMDDLVVGERSGEIISRHRAVDPSPPVEERGKVVALTFDDGPTPQWTPQVLQILKDEGIIATFCVVGHWADTRGDLVRAERDAGMTMCDHTEHHVLHLDQKPHDQVVQEVIGGADAIKAQLGVDPPLFRSPGGFLSPDVIAVAHTRGLRVLHWTVDPHDYERPPPQVIFDRVMAQVHPGAVILLHDGGGDRANTVAQLRQLIDTLKAQGYGFATPLGPPPPPI